MVDQLIELNFVSLAHFVTLMHAACKALCNLNMVHFVFTTMLVKMSGHPMLVKISLAILHFLIKDNVLCALIEPYVNFLNIVQALDHMGAERLGHGYHAYDDDTTYPIVIRE